jgi:cytochrome P450
MEVFITRTLAIPLDELQQLSKSDRGYTFLSALALYTRDAKQIRDQLVAVLLAGRDTTAATLSWVLHELSCHPEMVRRLRSEIAEHVKPGQTPSFAELKAMKYLQAILSETLRMYPAIPFNMRIALEDTFLPHGGGADGNQSVAVKKDTIIAYTPLVMMRRDDLYPAAYADGTEFPDPARFDPERWLHASASAEKGVAANGTADGSNPTWSPRPWTYIPFNGGPRVCLGQQFALTEMAYTLVRIFQRFARVELRMAPEEAGVLSSNVVLTPKNGVRVAFFTDDQK